MTRSELPPAPAPLLPHGVTTNRHPRIEWRATADYESAEVRVRDAATGAPVWESGPVASAPSWVAPPPPLPATRDLAWSVRVRASGPWSAWSADALFRIEPTPPLSGEIFVYSLHATRNLPPARAFEEAHFAAALQGLVNRDRPRLLLDFVKDLDTGATMDQYWFDRLREPDAWLAQATWTNIATLEELAERFAADIAGAVVWDPAVPATSNVASTIAGCRGLLPVRPSDEADGLYRRMVESGPRLAVAEDLRGKFAPRAPRQSAKAEAYLWALDEYLRLGPCNPARLAYYIDADWIRNPAPGRDFQNHTLTNHDFFIAERAYFCDLHVWGDEVPVDEPDQTPGTDLAVLKEVLAAANVRLAPDQMIHAGGFTPWAFKYTDAPGAGGTRDGVATEWEMVRVFSAYNAFLDADALHLSAMANASFYRHHPLPRRYAPPPVPQPADLRARGVLTDDHRPAARQFVLHYVGDYDAAAWVAQGLPARWDHAKRGEVPMAWALNPNLAERIAPFFEYAMRTRTARDAFMTGDSGPGYINPTQLHPPRNPSALPDATTRWQSHARHWYQQFGMTMTGFLINGLAGPITPEAEAVYEPISPDGIVNQYGRANDSLHLRGAMPVFLLHSDLPHDPAAAAEQMAEALRSDATPFFVFRTVLQSPGFYAELEQCLRESAPEIPFTVCLPADFSLLARLHLTGEVPRRATLLFETLPDELPRGTLAAGSIALRNDGWQPWEDSDHPVLVVELLRRDAAPPVVVSETHIPRAVPPGGAVLIEAGWQVPDAPAGAAALQFRITWPGGAGETIYSRRAMIT